MAKLIWDNVGEKKFKAGVDRGVLYPVDNTGAYPLGVAWNGLITISESPEGGDENAFYADNIKYGTLRGTEDFGGSIEAYYSPREFDLCDGTAELTTGVFVQQQTRKTFGLSYRTLIGNDVMGLDYGYEIHLVYGASASPSEKSRETVNESPDAQSLSWDFTTVPVPVTGYKPASHLVIDSTLFTTTEAQDALTAFEDIIYGTDNVDPRLPLPDEVKSLLSLT